MNSQSLVSCFESQFFLVGNLGGNCLEWFICLIWGEHSAKAHCMLGIFWKFLKPSRWESRVHLNLTSWCAICGLSSSSGNGEEGDIKCFITCGKWCASLVLSCSLLRYVEGFICADCSLPPCNPPSRGTAGVCGTFLPFQLHWECRDPKKCASCPWRPHNPLCCVISEWLLN